MAKLRGWPWNQIGMQFASLVYNIYVQATLGFTAQVARVPAEVDHIEKCALRTATPGPGGWVLPTDLSCQCFLGFLCFSVKNLRFTPFSAFSRDDGFLCSRWARACAPLPRYSGTAPNCSW